jgi:hypothetical protein
MEVHTYDAEAAGYYAQFINGFQEKLKSRRKKVYSLVVPTQIEFITNKSYKGLSSPQKATIDYVYKHLSEKITPVNAYDKLKQNSGKYIYFRSDHHWTALGAYYAYCAFMEAKGEKPVPLERYKKETISPYLGSLYSTTLAEKIKEHPDSIDLYKPFTKHKYEVHYTGGPIETDLLDMGQAKNKNKYGIFLGGDHPWGKIATSVKNGKKILVVKDSYANAFVPFLLPHYQEIYIVDPRQFKLDIFEFIKKNDIDEVLFLNYVLVTDNKGFTDLLLDMCDKYEHVL